MFNFLPMMNTYDERKVDNFTSDDVKVDTCRVTDGNQLYETGVKHPDYNDNEWIIVEAYDGLDEAKNGHNKWVKIMTNEPLPEYLEDCYNSGISQLLPLFTSDDNVLKFFRNK